MVCHTVNEAEYAIAPGSTEAHVKSTAEAGRRRKEYVRADVQEPTVEAATRSIRQAR
jgi:hypothetical protein